MKTRWPWLALGLAALVVVLSSLQLMPPAPLAASAPAEQFSAERAFKHVAEIAQRPHPVGSAENARVGQYIVEQIGALGLKPELFRGTTMQTESFGVIGGYSTSVLVRIPGTDSSKPLLLMGHFDSVMTGPGASDDGSAVATMLETLRALKAGPPLKNDLIVLFTDGEEYGMLGGRAFARSHPWAKEVGAVINLEARGSTGPSILFRTVGDNAWLIDQVAQAGGRQLASSFLNALMKVVPNDTDLSAWKDSGVPGVDFAYIGKFETYHAATDSPMNTNLASLQHHGMHAMSLVRTLGNANLADLPKGDAIFFTLFGLVVHYPQGWAWPFMLLALAAFVTVLALGLRRRALTWKGIVWATLLQVAGLAASAALAWLLLRAVEAIAPVPLVNGVVSAYNQFLYGWAVVALACAVQFGLTLLLRRHLTATERTAGGLVCWLILSLAMTALLPAGCYLFQIPLLVGLGGLALQIRPSGAARRAAALAVPLLAALLWVPTLTLLFTAMSLPLYPIVAVFTGFFLVLQPLLWESLAELRWWLPATGVVVAGAMAATALIRLGDAPRYNEISYWLNKDDNTARFVTTDTQLDDWTRTFFPNGAQASTLAEVNPLGPYAQIATLSGPAPVVDLEAPFVEATADTAAGGVRSITLQIATHPQCTTLYLYVTPETELVSAALGGMEVQPAAIKQGSGFVMLNGVRSEGVSLKLQVKFGSKVGLTAIGQCLGLLVPHTPRPEGMIPKPFMNSDMTTSVGRTYQF